MPTIINNRIIVNASVTGGYTSHQNHYFYRINSKQEDVMNVLLRNKRG